MFALLEVLLVRRWFKEIQVNRMPVGHTHEIVDQVSRVCCLLLALATVCLLLQKFRTLRSAIRHHNITDTPSFVSTVQRAYKDQKVSVVAIEQALDVQAWIKEHTQPHVHYLNQALGLLLRLDSDGNPGFVFKKAPATDSVWLGEGGVETGKPIRILGTIPSGLPKPVAMEWSPSPKLVKSAVAALPFLDQEQQHWLQHAVRTGDLGIRAEPVQRPGEPGQRALAVVGERKATFHTIRHFAADVLDCPASARMAECVAIMQAPAAERKHNRTLKVCDAIVCLF